MKKSEVYRYVVQHDSAVTDCLLQMSSIAKSQSDLEIEYPVELPHFSHRHLHFTLLDKVNARIPKEDLGQWDLFRDGVILRVCHQLRDLYGAEVLLSYRGPGALVVLRQMPGNVLAGVLFELVQEGNLLSISVSIAAWRLHGDSSQQLSVLLTRCEPRMHASARRAASQYGVVSVWLVCMKASFAAFVLGPFSVFIVGQSNLGCLTAVGAMILLFGLANRGIEKHLLLAAGWMALSLLSAYSGSLAYYYQERQRRESQFSQDLYHTLAFYLTTDLFRDQRGSQQLLSANTDFRNFITRIGDVISEISDTLDRGRR